MPAYNREAICQFCNTKIIPPKKGFRSSANGNYICEDCVKLLGQALDVRGKSDGKAKAKKRNMPIRYFNSKCVEESANE